MSKKSLPKEKPHAKSKPVEKEKPEEKVFLQDTDLDMKISLEKWKKGMPDPGPYKKADNDNEDRSMDRNVL